MSEALTTIKASDTDAVLANALTWPEIENLANRMDTMPTPLELLLEFEFPGRAFTYEDIGRLRDYIFERRQLIRTLIGNASKN